MNKDGDKTVRIFNDEMSQEKISKYQKEFSQDKRQNDVQCKIFSATYVVTKMRETIYFEAHKLRAYGFSS